MGEVSLLMSDSNCPETTGVETRLWGLSGWISTWSSSHRSSHRSRVRCFSQLLWQIPPVRPLKLIIMINLWLHRISCSVWLIPSNPGLTFEGLFLKCEATRLQKQNLNDTSWGEGCRSSFKQIGPAPPPPWLEFSWWSGEFLWEIREMWAWAFRILNYRSCLYVCVDATIAHLCKRIRNELDDQGSPQHTAHSPKCVHSGMKVKRTPSVSWSGVVQNNQRTFLKGSEL